MSISSTRPIQNITAIRLSIVIGLIFLSGLLLYQSAVIEVFSAVINREDSSHGVFVPFLSLYFIWLKRDIIRDIKPQFDYLGIVLIGIGAIFPLLQMANFQIHFLCFIVFIAGLFLSFFGRTFFKEVSFPLFFLITMIPIPENIYEAMANITRHISFNGSLKIISLLGIPHFKQGWLIQLPNAVLKVAIACSGIRYLISYFVFGIAYAWLCRDKVSSRVLIVVSTIPISLFASICRLTAIFLLTYTIGPRMAELRPHIITSWIVFFTILVASITIDQYFQKRRYARTLGCPEAGRLKG